MIMHGDMGHKIKTGDEIDCRSQTQVVGTEEEEGMSMNKSREVGVINCL